MCYISWPYRLGKLNAMDVTKDEENLIRARRGIEHDLIPLLREFFKIEWNGQKQSNEPAWSDCGDDGKALCKKLKCSHLDKKVTEKLKSGKTDEWDATCLFEAILTLVKGAEKSSIGKLRKQRNMVFHRSRGRLSDDEKNEFFQILKKEYTNMKWPTDDLDRIETESISTEEMKKLKSKLESEKRKGKVLKMLLDLFWRGAAWRGMAWRGVAWRGVPSNI